MSNNELNRVGENERERESREGEGEREREATLSGQETIPHVLSMYLFAEVTLSVCV